MMEPAKEKQKWAFKVGNGHVNKLSHWIHTSLRLCWEYIVLKIPIITVSQQLCQTHDLNCYQWRNYLVKVSTTKTQRRLERKYIKEEFKTLRENIRLTCTQTHTNRKGKTTSLPYSLRGLSYSNIKQNVTRGSFIKNLKVIEICKVDKEMAICFSYHRCETLR